MSENNTIEPEKEEASVLNFNQKYNTQFQIEDKIDRSRGGRYCGKDVLTSLSRKSFGGWLNVKQIAEKTGCSISSVRKHLRRFIKKGVVCVEKHEKNGDDALECHWYKIKVK